MSELFFSGNALWFSILALVGTLFFLLRLGLMLVGGDHDAHADVDADTDFDGHDHADSDDAFKVLSIQSIASFFMGFGWGGLGALRGAGWDVPASLAVGLICGSGTVWLLAKMLRFAYGLQATGNVSIHDTLDLEGSVYVAVPAGGGGRGQVKLIVGDKARYYAAVSQDEPIETASRVRVVAVNDDNTVTVTRA